MSPLLLYEMAQADLMLFPHDLPWCPLGAASLRLDLDLRAFEELRQGHTHVERCGFRAKLQALKPDILVTITNY